MLSMDKVQVHANVPRALKERLLALKEVDGVLYSESRVIWQCIEGFLPNVEGSATSPFSTPTKNTPGPRRKLSRA